jgi:hypothetical protein
MHIEETDQQSKDKLCLLLVDGTNVRLTIFNLWNENGDGVPREGSINAQFEPIAKYLQQRLNISPDNIEKCIFAKQQRDPNGSDEDFKTDRQDSFRHALEQEGWKLAIRAPKPDTDYGDKANDVDDDLLEYAEEFLATAEKGDILVIMTNDFSDTPKGNNVYKTLQNARSLGMGAIAIAFKDLAFNTISSSPPFEIVDSRDIDGVYDIVPPKPRSVADVEPGELAWFAKPWAVTVVDRRPPKVNTEMSKLSYDPDVGYDPDVVQVARTSQPVPRSTRGPIPPPSVPRPPALLTKKPIPPGS